MKGWILTGTNPEEGLNYSLRRFKEVAEARGIDLKIYNPQSFELIVSRNDKKSLWIQGKECDLPDFVLPRTGSATTYFGLALIRQLEHLNIYVCNKASVIEMVKDKLRIHQLLAQSDLPTPKTMLLKFPIDIEFVKQEIGFPLVIKNVTGSKGRGISLCESADQFKDLMDLMYSYNNNMNIIIQEFITFKKGVDLRVFVVGGRVIGCMKRIAKEGFKANFSLGGTVEMFPPTPEIEWLAIRTANLLGLEIAGIDLLFDTNGFKVLEANSAPGFAGMEEAIGHCIAEKIFDYINLKVTGKIN